MNLLSEQDTATHIGINRHTLRRYRLKGLVATVYSKGEGKHTTHLYDTDTVHKILKAVDKCHCNECDTGV